MNYEIESFTPNLQILIHNVHNMLNVLNENKTWQYRKYPVLLLNLGSCTHHLDEYYNHSLSSTKTQQIFILIKFQKVLTIARACSLLNYLACISKSATRMII